MRFPFYHVRHGVGFLLFIASFDPYLTVQLTIPQDCTKQLQYFLFRDPDLSKGEPMSFTFTTKENMNVGQFKEAVGGSFNIEPKKLFCYISQQYSNYSMGINSNY